MCNSFTLQLKQLLDDYNSQHHALEQEINRLPQAEALNNPIWYKRTHHLAHTQARALTELVWAKETCAATEILQNHPIHSQVLLQSAFIRHAYLRPYGYPGDKDLMLMICQKTDVGESNYAILQNRVYLNLPAAEAVRQRVGSMKHYLMRLPAQSKVLNVACGPALEVSQLFAQQPECSLAFDLVDHDPRTIQYTQLTIHAPTVRHIIGNAIRMALGLRDVELVTNNHATEVTTFPQTQSMQLASESYDLVYSMGLYDYLLHHPGHCNKGTIGLTQTLFDLVKPGGTLIIGNYLAPSPINPHTFSHRLMMECYSNWQLHYRTYAELFGFTESLELESYKVTLTNEYFDTPPLQRGTIGFLLIHKYL
ncbi:MAG: hypothetical protein U0175_35570 [Caldilineaceae bacterium]